MQLGRALATGLVVLAATCAARRAEAIECADLEAWAARCSTPAMPVAVRQCRPEAVVRVGTTEPLDVEVKDRPAFRAAGDVWLQPVGEFSDWKAEPEARRAKLDLVAACAEKESPRTHRPKAAAAGPTTPAPWLFVVGLLATGLALIGRRPLHLAGGVVAAAATWLVRSLVVPATFFHQNGQGPVWVAEAFTPSAAFSYGPGYAELFHAAAHASDRSPETGVMALASVLGALATPAMVSSAQRAGASYREAWLLGAVVAIDPVLARLCSSESYWGVIVSLLALATWLVGEGAVRAIGMRVICFAGAGCLVAAAARVHPAAWVPSAFVPLAALAMPGSLRVRARRAAAAAVAVGLVATATAGPAIKGVLEGPLGEKWLGHAGASDTASWPWLSLLPAGALALRHREAALALALAALVPLVAWRTNVVSSDALLIRVAHWHTYLPAGAVAIAFAAGRFGPRVAWLPAIAAGVSVWPALVEVRRLPTSAEEGRFFATKRADLPASARVCFVERAGLRVAALPYYPGGHPSGFPLAEGASVAETPCTHYARSSLCSSPEGRSACARAEAGTKLIRIAAVELAAVSDLPWLPYDVSRLEISLHEVQR